LIRKQFLYRCFDFSWLKIAQLSRSILECPYEGNGKPEPLKHELTRYWYRRITREHRYVYAIIELSMIVASLKGHY